MEVLNIYYQYCIKAFEIKTFKYSLVVSVVIGEQQCIIVRMYFVNYQRSRNTNIERNCQYVVNNLFYMRNAARLHISLNNFPFLYAALSPPLPPCSLKELFAAYRNLLSHVNF